MIISALKDPYVDVHRRRRLFRCFREGDPVIDLNLFCMTISFFQSACILVSFRGAWIFFSGDVYGTNHTGYISSVSTMTR